MNENWIPVAFAAVVVIGVVGGTIAQMVLKELLPLLRSIAEQRQQPLPPADPTLVDTLARLERRLDRLEATCDRLEEDRQFMRQLLAGKDTMVPAPADEADR
jgi:hypothetical protein